MAKKKKTIQSPPRKQYNLFLLFIIFLAAAFLFYSNILTSSWVLDDFNTIVERDSLRNNSIFAKVNISRYLGYITFALNYKINKFDTLGYHIVNIIIHAINALLIYVLFRKLYLLMHNERESDSYKLLPLCIAAIFLLHPIQTQAVTYIVQRFTSLSTLFALATLIAYINFRTSSRYPFWWYGLALLGSLCAYKTKENTATIPLMIAVMEILVLRKYAMSWKKTILFVLPFFILVLVIPLSMAGTRDPANQHLGNLLSDFKQVSYETTKVSRSQYLITEFSVIMFYMRLLLFPINQSLHYLYPFAASFFEIKTFLSFCAIAAILIMAKMISKKYGEISFGIYWFFIFLLVESSIIPIQDAIYEHRLYLPSIGFISACVYGIYLLLRKYNVKIFLGVIFIVLIAFGIATYKRNGLWRNEAALWKNVLETYPQDYIAHTFMGTYLMKQEHYDKALAELKEAAAINPDYAPAHSNLGLCYDKLQMPDDSIREYNLAIQAAPGLIMPYYNLSSVYYKQRNIAEARRLLEQAKSIDDKNPLINTQLARMHCAMREYDTAFTLFQLALSQQPDNPTIYGHYGTCLLNSGRNQEGRNALLKAIALNPEEVDSYFFIALSYDADRDIANARRYYQEFIQRAPLNSPYLKPAKDRLQQM